MFRWICSRNSSRQRWRKSKLKSNIDVQRCLIFREISKALQVRQNLLLTFPNSEDHHHQQYQHHHHYHHPRHHSWPVNKNDFSVFFVLFFSVFLCGCFFSSYYYWLTFTLHSPISFPFIIIIINFSSHHTYHKMFWSLFRFRTLCKHSTTTQYKFILPHLRKHFWKSFKGESKHLQIPEPKNLITFLQSLFCPHCLTDFIEEVHDLQAVETVSH